MLGEFVKHVYNCKLLKKFNFSLKKDNLFKREIKKIHFRAKKVQ